jgi:hypothetical protein
MSKEYQCMLRFLNHATDEQITELFYDLENIDLVEKMGDLAYIFVEYHAIQQQNKFLKPIIKSGEVLEYSTQSYENELKDADDAQRYRDIKSTQDSLK